MAKDVDQKTQKKIKDAVSKMDDFFNGKTPRKTLEQAKEDRDARNKESTAYLKSRNEKVATEGRAKDKADLPNLKKRQAELSDVYEKGKNWQTADRDQNMTPDERRAREVSGELQRLGARISDAERDASYAKGGRISLKHCKVSTHKASPKNKNW